MMGWNQTLERGAVLPDCQLIDGVPVSKTAGEEEAVEIKLAWVADLMEVGPNPFRLQGDRGSV